MGEIIGIRTDLLLEKNQKGGKCLGEKRTLIYTVEDEDGIDFDVDYRNIYANKCQAERMLEFTCRIYFTDCAYQEETIIAKKEGDAFEGLKRKYPNACSIQHAW